VAQKNRRTDQALADAFCKNKAFEDRTEGERPTAMPVSVCVLHLHWRRCTKEGKKKESYTKDLPPFFPNVFSSAQVDGWI
jgi:hypothetical protein